MKKGTIKSLLFIAGGTATAGFMVWQVFRDLPNGHIFSHMPLLFALAVATVVLFMAGLAGLIPVEQNGTEPPSDFRHTFPLIATVGVVIVLAVVARQFLLPPTFGQFGRYRGDAVAAAANARTPRHVGKETCVSCHDQVGETISKNAHHKLNCEVCHGPGMNHVEAGGGAETITKPRGDKNLCLTCHRKLVARPADFPQIRWEEHFEAVGAEKEAECMSCHEPHQPASWFEAPAATPAVAAGTEPQKP